MNDAAIKGDPGNRVPLCTYRLQFNSQFAFSQARQITEYLHELGIEDCYASPLFQAGPDSTHGYDICSFAALNPAIGSEADFSKWCAALQEQDMGLLVDMVPNHMGNDLSNRWWLDVLEKGPNSRYAAFFDINWQPLKSDIYNKVLLPTLGDHYGKVLLNGELKLGFEEGKFVVAYYDKKFPVALHSYPALLRKILARATGLSGEKLDQARPFEKLIEIPGQWQLGTEDSYCKIAEFEGELAQWQKSSQSFREGLRQLLKELKGKPNDRSSFDGLDALIRQQFYRLAYWRVGPEEINYRRFFDVTSLVSLKMEREEVFNATHDYLFSLIQQGFITGLRIDHPDGLWDPSQYFQRLQSKYRSLTPNANDKSSSHSSRNRPERPFYVVAEKILSGDEPLPLDWAVEGTTGYDYLNCLNGIFVNTDNEPAFTLLYEEFTGIRESFEDLMYRSKKWILEHSLYSEWISLCYRLKRIAQASRDTQDFSVRQLQAAIGEIAATFPVYRTYVRDGIQALPLHEQGYVEEAFLKARKRNASVDPAVWSFFQDMLLLKPPPGFDPGGCIECREFVMKFQQLSGPLMAKGLEDTAFYNYNRLVSLNEVGGSPEHFGVSPEAFHEYNRMRAELWPHSLSATATHDTKRGEDLRARLNVLSELPEEWRATVLHWRHLNQDKVAMVAGQPAPHPNDEYLLYQTLVGAWDPKEDAKRFRNRVSAYMEKAMKEAKARTTWTDPNPEYEAAVKQFIERVLDEARNSEFLNHFKAFQQRVAFFGLFNSLSQTLLKITTPGVPDFYQGTELWDLSLVDPDNRRPVDYNLRQELLADLKSRMQKGPQADLARQLLHSAESGQVKMFLVHAALQARRQFRSVFEHGSYVPLTASGPQQSHVFAFHTSFQNQSVLVVVPRLICTLTGGNPQAPLGQETWNDTLLDLSSTAVETTWHNLLTGESLKAQEQQGRGVLRLADVFASFPVAILHQR
ncbi:MAG: maltooligosyl trehalose synthase [Verrucomicrobiales bacterium]|nr:maltooligosyl trehalose synthase [Verrucomicrobiales bacterium]